MGMKGFPIPYFRVHVRATLILEAFEFGKKEPKTGDPTHDVGFVHGGLKGPRQCVWRDSLGKDYDYTGLSPIDYGKPAYLYLPRSPVSSCLQAVLQTNVDVEMGPLLAYYPACKALYEIPCEFLGG